MGFLNKFSKGKNDDDDDDDEDDSKVQRVQVEGVTDVRPVGESGGLAKKTDDGDTDSSDGSDDGKDDSKDDKDKSAEPSGELDLNSLFAEEEVNAEDLAGDLQEFLSELENRTSK